MSHSRCRATAILAGGISNRLLPFWLTGAPWRTQHG